MMKSMMTIYAILICSGLISLGVGTARQADTMDTNIIDFKVNEDGGKEDVAHLWPAVVIDTSGTYVITWYDYRNGTNNPDIFAQRYTSDGSALGSNFKVNDDYGISSQTNPAIAMGASGNFVIAWTDERNETSDIYAQRYANDGNPIDANFKINQVHSDLSTVAIDKNDNIIIVWMEARYTDGYDIYAQRYAGNGDPIGENFKVNDDPDSTSQWAPSIAINNSGSFIIAWLDTIKDTTDIYAQRYAGNGDALGKNFRINTTPVFKNTIYNTTNKTSLFLADDGSFVVTWTDRNWDKYVRRFSSDGSAVGENFRVDEFGFPQNPSIAADASGNYIIVWQRASPSVIGKWDVYAQRFTSDDSKIGVNFPITDQAGDAMQYSFPAVCMKNTGEFVVTWVDIGRGKRYPNRDIYAQRYDSDGSALGNNTRVTDTPGHAYHGFSAIAVGETGSFVITWVDTRNQYSDIYTQRYANDGSPIGVNFMVNNRREYGGGGSPAIAADANCGFVITWLEATSNENRSIFAQRYVSDGTAIDSNFRVHDGPGSRYQLDPEIAMNAQGDFVITWSQTYEIYARCYASDGTPKGQEFMVTDSLVEGSKGCQSIAMAEDGSIIVTWRFSRESNIDHIFAKRFSDDGTAISSTFRVNDDTSSQVHDNPSITMNGYGEFVIAWENYRNRTGDDQIRSVYAQCYSGNGQAVGQNFRVTEEPGGGRSPSISADKNGNFIIAWSFDGRLYAKRYIRGGDAVGTLFILSGSEETTNPDICLRNGRIYATWTFTGGAFGYEIWANVSDWSYPIDIREPQRVDLPVNFGLQQNYPNPFNPTTVIRYQLSACCDVELTVYNSNGQRVTTLVSERQAAGSYQVEWDAQEFASGIYFCRLVAGNGAIASRKLVLLK